MDLVLVNVTSLFSPIQQTVLDSCKTSISNLFIPFSVHITPALINLGRKQGKILWTESLLVGRGAHFATSRAGEDFSDVYNDLNIVIFCLPSGATSYMGCALSNCAGCIHCCTQHISSFTNWASQIELHKSKRQSKRQSHRNHLQV